MSRSVRGFWWIAALSIVVPHQTFASKIPWSGHGNHQDEFKSSTSPLHGLNDINTQENEIDFGEHSTGLKSPTSTTHGLDHMIHHNNKENEVDNGGRLVGPKSPASALHDEVDIFKLINVSSKNQGVSLVEGPIKGFPAYKFRLPYGDVPLANSTNITKAMSGSNGFTVVFLYRQQKNNLGTLISVNSPGRLTPWFQITSNLKTGVLTLKYRTDGGTKVHQIDWRLPSHHRKSPLAAWTWMSVSADFSTGTLWLDLDCQPSKFESIAPSGPHKSNTPSSATRIGIPRNALIYFRQEPGRKKKFLGSIQVAKVLPYVTQERLWSCLHITDRPTAPEHRKPLL